MSDIINCKIDINTETMHHITNNPSSEAEALLLGIFQQLKSCVAVYQPTEDGEDFVFVDFNSAAEKVEKVSRDDILGRKVTEVFPGVKDLGLWEILRKVVQSGEAQFLSSGLCKDGRMSGWREHYVFKLPSGNLVAIYEDITQRKKAEKALLENEQRYRIIAEHTGSLLYDYDIDSGEIKWIGAIPEVTGFAAKEFSDVDIVKWEEMIHPEDRERIVFVLNQSCEQGSVFAVEYRFAHKDGGYRNVYDEGVCLTNEEGKAFRMLGVMRDKTAQKKAEKESIKLAHVVEQSPSTIVITDIEGRIEYVNPRFSQVTGYALDEVKGKNPRLLKSGDFSSRDYQVLWEKITSGQEWHGEFRNRRKDGNSYWEVASISPVRDEQGQIIHFLKVAEDITERKQTEDKLIQSESNYRAIFDSANDAIFVHDADTGEILDGNKKTEELYGYSVEEMRKLEVGDISCGSEGFSQQEALYRVRKAKEGSPQLFEWLAKDRSGRSFWVEVNLKLVTIGGQPRLLALVRDISERKGIDKIKTGLLRDVTHGLKSPIAMAQTGLDILAKGMDSDDKELIQKGQQIAGKNVKKLFNDVNKIVTMFSMEMNRDKLREKTELCVEEVVNASINEMADLIFQQKVTVERNISPKANRLWANRRDMELLTGNIIENAVKFAEGGSVWIAAKINHEGKFQMTVKDNGCGIELFEINRVFDKFYKQSAVSSGSGLGLAICKEIISRYQGDIRVRSEGKGYGTEVIFVLPSGEKQ